MNKSKIDDMKEVIEKVYVANCNGHSLLLEMSNLLIEVRDGNKGFVSIVDEFPQVVYLTKDWEEEYEEYMKNLISALDKYLI